MNHINIDSVRSGSYDEHIAKTYALNVHYNQIPFFHALKNRPNTILSKWDTYAISMPNYEKQYSLGYVNCHGLLLVQRETNGLLLSSMAHYRPDRLCSYDLSGTLQAHTNLHLLQSDLYKVLEEFDSEEPIEAVFFGGNYLGDQWYKDDLANIGRNPSKDQYKYIMRDMMKILDSKDVKDITYIGPKTTRNSKDNVYFDPEKDMLSIVRNNEGIDTKCNSLDQLFGRLSIIK